MYGVTNLIPFLFFAVWLALIGYVILLATRLVNAIEQIARALSERPPNRFVP